MAWSQRITEIDGRAAGVLIDERFRDSAPVRELPRLTWFGVYCRLDPGSAFWHPDETEELDTIEADLIRLCDHLARGWAVYVMRLDTRCLREYYLYNSGDVAIENVLPTLQAAHPNHRIECSQTTDAEWEGSCPRSRRRNKAMFTGGC